MGKLIEDILKRVDRDAIQKDLIMEVRSGRSAGIAHLAYFLTPFNHLALAHENLIQVGILGCQSITMFDYNGFTVTKIPSNVCDNPIGWRDDGRAHSIADVESPVKLLLIRERRNPVAEA